MATSGYAIPAGAQAAKQERQIAAMLETSHRHADSLQQAINRTDEMRGRLLGIREPSQINAHDKVPTPIEAELSGLRSTLEHMGGLLEKLHSNLRDLEAI